MDRRNSGNPYETSKFRDMMSPSIKKTSKKWSGQKVPKLQCEKN